MISVVYLEKDKWIKHVWADGRNAGVEYVYTLHFKGDVAAIQGVDDEYYPKIKSAQAMGGMLQLWIDKLPVMDVPLRVFWNEKKITYKCGLVKQLKPYRR